MVAYCFLLYVLPDMQLGCLVFKGEMYFQDHKVLILMIIYYQILFVQTCK